MIRFTGSTGQNLKRTTGLLSMLQDFTILCQSRLLTNSVPGDQTTVFVAYSNAGGGSGDYRFPFIWHGYTADGAGQNYLETEVANVLPEVQRAISLSSCNWSACVYTASSHSFDIIVNGVLRGTIPYNISSTPMVLWAVGSDLFNTGVSHDVCRYREWQAALTISELITEARYDSAQRTANLFTDTPLTAATDVTDHSGNGHNWTKTGSPTTVSACPDTPPFVPTIPVPLTIQAPCNPQSQVTSGGKGKSGCNVGGVGWVSGYSGPYATAPVHADPTDGELLTDKDGVEVWIELRHKDYPSGTVTAYRRSLVEIANASTYHGGRVTEGLISIGDIDHGLSNEQGSFAAANVNIDYSDMVDRLVRTLMQTQDLEFDEVYVFAATKAARDAGSTPRTLMRALVNTPTLSTPIKASLVAVDPLFAEFGPFGPNRQWPDKIPQLVGFTTPADVLSAPQPWLYGEKSDEGATDPATGKQISKGLMPVYFMGQENITRSVVQPPGAPTSALTYDSTIPNTGTEWAMSIIGQGHGTYDPANNLGNNDGVNLIYAWLIAKKGTSGNYALNSYGQAPAWNNSAWYAADRDPTQLWGAKMVWQQIADPSGQVDGYRVYFANASDFDPLGSPGSATKAIYFDHDLTTPGPDSTYGSYPFGVDGVNWNTGTNALATVTSPGGGIVDETLAWDFYAQTFHASYLTLGLYGSDQQGGTSQNTPDRVKLDINARNDILVPGYANWPFAQTYRDKVGTDGKTYRIYGFYARGPLSDNHKNGVVTFAWNGIGVEQAGDGSGLPYIDSESCKQHWLENPILTNSPSGLWADNTTYPIWNDGTAKVRSSSFLAWQAQLAALVGGRGLTIGWYVDKTQSLAEWFKEWNDSTESRLGVNSHGQIVVFGLDETVDPTNWPVINHIVDLFGSPTVERTVGLERENVVVGAGDWDPDAERFRAGPVTYPSAAGITKYKSHEKRGDPVESLILNDATQIAWQLQHRLTRLQFGVSQVPIKGRIGLLDTPTYEVGKGILLNSIEGTGASGYVLNPFIILRRTFSLSTRLTTLLLLDVKDFLNATNGTNSWIASNSTDAPVASNTSDAPTATL